MSSLTFPDDAETGAELARDLDDDGTPDNQLANIMSALVQASGTGLSFQDAVDEDVDRGEVLVLLEARASSFADATDAFGRLLEGASPVPAPCASVDDLLCRAHLQGAGTFSVVPPAPELAAGAIASGRLTLGDTSFSIPMTFGGELVWVPLTDGRIEADVEATGLASGRITGAVPAAAIDELLLGLHGQISAAVAEDCADAPVTPCSEGSTGETWLGIFDADDDGTVTLAEVMTSSIIQLLARPDVDTDGDGTPDGLSMGIGFEAVGATFPEP